MSVVERLLRGPSRECDERRRHVAELERLAERLRADAGRLLDELGAASAVPPPDADGGPGADGLVERHRKLERSLAELDVRMSEARAELATAEAQLQRQQRALAQRAVRAEAQRSREFRPLRRRGIVPGTRRPD